MFSSQISSEQSGAHQATEVLGQEFLDQISPEGHMFMFYLFRLESSVEFLFMLLFELLIHLTTKGANGPRRVQYSLPDPYSETWTQTQTLLGIKFMDPDPILHGLG
ncbi:hypothetical protein M9H77_17900 [Catharanthus roseus]|uniref:Uncharacterized protein n=1 Tax=Catharanthus roseus TaxID=4058 RepID=A0ACC0B659_CATRO|nr:hypothetical protein M9H77_17900 [Catharanthus roseus]